MMRHWLYCSLLAAAMCVGAPALSHADPANQLDRFFAGTAASPSYPFPGSERVDVAPRLAQTTLPGGSGSISSYGFSDRPTTGVSPTVANPYTSAILNGYYADFSKHFDYKVPGFALGPDVADGEGAPGFQLAETEVGLYGNVDPYWFGSIVLSFASENGVAVEEAFIQSTSLPYGLIVKAGRYHSSIGYLNVFHRHADDFVDTPLVYSAFLNGQLADDGVQVRWLAPLDVLLEFGAEIFNGKTWPATGSPDNGKGTNTQFIHLADDVGEGGSYLVGISHVDSSAVGRVTSGNPDPNVNTNGLSFTGTNTLNIASLVYKWSPLGNTKYTLFKFQTEYFQGDEHGIYTVLNPTGTPIPVGATIDLRGKNGMHRSGWYTQATYKFQERWRVAVRQSEVSSDKPKDANAIGTDLDPQGHTPTMTSAMVEFWPSEFSQFRVQYSSDQSSKQAVDRWYLQYIITLGAHAAHTY
jgi:hypothetical protein